MLGLLSGKKYPEDIQLVLPAEGAEGALYVSNREAAENSATLRRLDIRAVLSAAKNVILNHPSQVLAQYKYIPAEDHERFDLLPFFEEAGKFIAEARQRGNVLVHCIAGVSRSISLVIAYLIKHQGKGFTEAYSQVKARRPIMHPNDGFIAQLKEYERRQGSAKQSALADFNEGYRSRASHLSYLDALRKEAGLKPNPERASDNYRSILDSRQIDANPLLK